MEWYCYEIGLFIVQQCRFKRIHTNGVERMSNSYRAFAILAATLPAANMQKGVEILKRVQDWQKL